NNFCILIGNFCYLRGSCSSYDLTSPRLNFGDDVLQDSLNHLNISSSVEITFRVLRSRIETLEYDKVVKCEQKALESRLASSRQLIISQEENIHSKEQQNKTLKARLLSADLHARDKDAKIASLSVSVAISQKDGRSLGNMLHNELEQLRAEKVSSASDKQNLRKKIERLESERRELEAQRVRLERERAALKQHIETLELEKQKSDAASKQTNMEKLALDKSLTAMEKENKELYKNCSQLQKISQYDQAHSQSVKSLESKVSMLTKQLEIERKQRHPNFCDISSLDGKQKADSNSNFTRSAGKNAESL
uniref:Non-specific serine/threonine protein kinase n=1 Tax=Syphacia muris TaxID=451379 RepID=A0A0N5ANK6_9BILA